MSSTRLVAMGVAALVVCAAASAHAAFDPVKCRRAIAKNAAAFEETKVKSLQKCHDGVLKGKVTPPCPDSKAATKISAALQKAKDKITGACAGGTLSDMHFDGLTKQCDGGFFPGQPCNFNADCAGACNQGRYEGEQCHSDSLCQGFCGTTTPTVACVVDTDCHPTTDCVGGLCVTREAPQRACNNNGGCPTSGFQVCYEAGGICVDHDQCDPVNFCPSIQNDSNTEPFGLTPATDCYFQLTDAQSVADRVTCVGEQIVDQIDSNSFATTYAASTDKDVLKCQRTLGKAAAKHYATVRKSLQKCQDGVLKAGSGSCPDAKASAKISDSAQKLKDAINKACSDAPTFAKAFVLSQFIGRSGRPSGSCTINSLASDSTTVGTAVDCLIQAAVDCNDALGAGTPTNTTCDPLCGNGRLDAGETCDDGNRLQESGIGPVEPCPADCNVAAPCTTSGTQSVTVNFSAPGSPAPDLTALTIALYYDETKVQIQGSGDLSVANPGAFNSSSFAITPVDDDYALRLLLSDPTFSGVPSGTALTITFDTCQGQPAPVAADFHCFVADAADTAPASVAGVTCSVTVP